MKTVVFFLFCCFISIACLETALGAKHPLLLDAIGFGIWLLFVWYCGRRSRKRSVQREMERHFQDHMRTQMRRPGR